MRTINLFRLEPRINTLHLTWVAFFISFMVWFNHAPLMAAIRTSLKILPLMRRSPVVAWRTIAIAHAVIDIVLLFKLSR